MPDKQTMTCVNCETDRYIGLRGMRGLYPCTECQEPTEHERI